MGERRSFYAEIFSFLLRILKKYYTRGAIPFETSQEYEFIRQFHRDMEELLGFGNCRIAAELYRILSGTIQSRQLPFCRNPKKMLSEIWNIFSVWAAKPFDQKLKMEILDYLNDFSERWKDEDIAIDLIVLFAGEVEEMNNQMMTVA